MLTVLITTITFILLLAVTTASFYIGYKLCEVINSREEKEPEKKAKEQTEEDKLRSEGLNNILNYAKRHQKKGGDNR